MAKKSSSRRSASRTSSAASSLPVSQVDVFYSSYRAGDYAKALKIASAMLRAYPLSAQAHELHANALGRLERLSEASEAMQKAVELTPAPSAAQQLKLAQYQVLAGKAIAAVEGLQKVLQEQPEHIMALAWSSRAYHQLGDNRKALEISNKALALDKNHEEVLLWRSRILDQLKCHDDAMRTLETLLKVSPERIGANNHMATLFVKEGDYRQAEGFYNKELELDSSNGKVYSNLLVAAYYNPEYSAEELRDKAVEWDRRFSQRSESGRASTCRDNKKRLRVGLLSGGFRVHPVGQMIYPALANLNEDQFEVIAYSTSQIVDGLTQKIQKAVSRWEVVEGLGHSQLDKKIRDDRIDILIDMNGAGEGSRYFTLSREPAPLIVKWVGSLIGSTGLKCFDYLLSDSVETPEGADRLYTERLIRLPNDYICYHPPEHAPKVNGLPALANGYITFGCLNNPAKLSPPMLAEWASLLKEVANSKLLLRGIQFESPRYRDKVSGILAEHGVSEDRLIMEGPAQHQEFMATYQRIDIALDTWPYSGGLTTCEALLMGVPVVTHVGPTFAGRHSATHLVNAGLPELVTGSWEDFRIRAKELANDLPSLAVIRASLRTILMDSPICNGPRFANHLTTALRAIWQRHCEGKKPEVLTFSKSGAAQFADEDTPVKLALALPTEGFDWQLESPVVAIDNGAVLAARADARDLLGSGRIVMLSFDPAGRMETVDHLAQYGEIQHFPYTALGDGQSTVLRLGGGLEPTTLELLDADADIETHEIPTVALDSIEGLPNIDLLALDASHDVIKILNHAEKALKSTLLVQARVAFQPSLHDQPDFARVHAWMAHQGFRFYCFSNEQFRSHLPDSVPVERRQATELVCADAIFLPGYKRMALLSDAQRTKLAFILHTMLGAKDMAYSLLKTGSEELAREYISTIGDAERQKKSQQACSNSEMENHVESSDTVSKDVDQLLEQVPCAIESMPKENRQMVSQLSMSGTNPAAVHKINNKSLWALDEPIHVVDVGANPIDGTPPYAGLLKRGLVKLVGFEPQKEALQKLQAMKGPSETYLPHAVGTGQRTKLYLCQASGMTSTLKPNSRVLDHFQGYPVWGKVKSVEEIDTVRLDDVHEIEKVDWLKIDIQGGELNVFKNAEKKLKETLVIQTEVNFLQLYENQPLFAEIDQWMRAHGFMLHALTEQRKRLYAPMKINGGIHQGINQLTTADAVYIRDINSLDNISQDGVKKIAFILHEAYGSYDLSYRLLKGLGLGFEEDYAGKIKKSLPINISLAESKESVEGVKHCFVVGCGHTGTTLMATMLSENDHIYTVKRETSWFLRGGDFSRDFDKERCMALEKGAEWLCEKTPKHVYCYEKIIEKVPGAKFLVMTRSARDVVASIKNRTGDFDSALSRWIKDNEEALKVVGSGDSMLVCYEDLVLFPEKELRKVCGFLGVPFSKSMLSYHESKDGWFGIEAKKTDGKGEQAHLQRRAWQMHQPLQDRRGIWKNILTSEETEIVDVATRHLMVKLGYDV